MKFIKKTHKEFIQDLKIKNPYVYNNTIFLEEYKGNTIKILAMTKYGLVMAYPKSLMKGVRIGIGSAINKTDYTINQFREIHGVKYNYNNFIYVSSLTPCIITCPLHGDFKQAPSAHIFSNRGCLKCGQERATGSYSIKRAEKNKKEWLKIPCIVYFAKLHGNKEIFYKIGITTTNFKNRFWGVPYEVEEIKIINLNLYEAVYLEQKMHKKHENYRYTPLIKFGGHTECFSKLLRVEE